MKMGKVRYVVLCLPVRPTFLLQDSTEQRVRFFFSAPILQASGEVEVSSTEQAIMFSLPPRDDATAWPVELVVLMAGMSTGTDMPKSSLSLEDCCLAGIGIEWVAAEATAAALELKGEAVVEVTVDS